MLDAPEEGRDVEMIEGTVSKRGAMGVILDPRIMEAEWQSTPIEEFEPFVVDLTDPTKTLLVGKELSLGDKQKLMNFFLDNLYIFSSKHGDMMGIDPMISCHHLNVDPKFTPHR